MERVFLDLRQLLKQKHWLRVIRLLIQSYNLTKWLNNSYPKYQWFFWGKVAPGIITGKRNIIACVIGSEIVGIACLKKAEEKKLSTLYIDSAYQKQGIGTEILERSFKWLGTRKPALSIAKDRLPCFFNFIVKYHWELTNIASNKYRRGASEHFFN